MKQAQWDLVKSIVDQALTLSGEERDTYVSTACQNNPDISAEIQELLRSIEESEEKEFMIPMRQDRKELISDLADELAHVTAHDNFIGKTIGSHRITELLGSGGMGTVYKARRVDGEYHHEVAIKLIKQGVDTEETIRRFRMEREILATLQHPNIAQIYDGGITGDGTPYLIMEHIEGMPIDKYCNEKHLTINERLDLYKDVCSAVQFAHINLIVHRDLKAQNIYVTKEGIVKVLDFGIAKLLDAGQTEMTLLETQPGQKLWTPQYAAPEQVKGESITTATDVYALGVLLHKLLTDTYPHNLEGKSISEVEKIIKDETPLPPSLSFPSNTSQKECAKLRKITAAELTKKLKGDLDSLVLKAIRKEPQYRYASVGQLKEDIERYLTGAPLLVRKGSLRYKTGKYIRRHKAGLAAAVLFLIAAISFAGFYTWQISKERDRAELQAKKAEQVSGFITNLFKESTPGEINGDTLTVRHALDIGAQKIKAELPEQPEIQAKILSVIGEVYHSLDLQKEAEELLETALEQQDQLPDEVILADKVQTLHVLSIVKAYLKKYNEAETIGRQALNLAENNFGKSAAITQACRYSLSTTLHSRAKFDDASELMDEWLTFSGSKNNARENTQVAQELIDKSQIFLMSGKRHEAEQMLRKALNLRLAEFGENHYEVAKVLVSLADAFRASGKYSEAEFTNKKAIQIFEDVESRNNEHYAFALRSLAGLLTERGAYSQADSLFKRSIFLHKESFGSESFQVKFTQALYANTLIEQNKFPEALKLLNEAYTFYEEKFGENILHALNAKVSIATIHMHMRDLNKAELMLESLVKRFDKKYGDKSHHSVRARTAYSNVLMLQHDLEKAETEARKGLELAQNFAPHDSYIINLAKQQLGICLMQQKRFKEAEVLLVESTEYWKNYSYNSEINKKAFEQLISLYHEWGKPEMAKSYQDQLALAEERSL